MSIGRGFEEKRAYQRMPIESPLTYSVDGQSNLYSGFCKNLSHSGIFFTTEQSLSKGQSISVTLGSKSEQFNPMKASIEIIRVQFSNDSKFGIAGKILKIQ